MQWSCPGGACLHSLQYWNWDTSHCPEVQYWDLAPGLDPHCSEALMTPLHLSETPGGGILPHTCTHTGFIVLGCLRVCLSAILEFAIAWLGYLQRQTCPSWTWHLRRGSTRGEGRPLTYEGPGQPQLGREEALNARSENDERVSPFLVAAGAAFEAFVLTIFALLVRVRYFTAKV